MLLDRAQHSAVRNRLDSVRLGGLPGIGALVIDGVPRIGRSRNTPPPADKAPEVFACQRSPVEASNARPRTG